jgi:hypothetical protein
MKKFRTDKMMALSTSAAVGLSAVTLVLLQGPGTTGQRLDAIKGALTDGVKATKGAQTGAGPVRVACNPCRDRG